MDYLFNTQTYSLQQIQILQSIYLEQFDMYEKYSKVYCNEYVANHIYTSNFVIWLQCKEKENQIESLINNYKSKFKQQ